ncbi:hypothetical protein M430DRAFT_36156 [Amorphotheca resinae ATCC 22711]|jgi:hypothetical protein|uniref:DSC E3 ubiquitin ligase complex subunit A n=1 Tax=Amorphotheca resinae ATCC 22711 TaxID=857342 RepID=A0A2T3AW94_AMORE|nr:hypothetical protein M430DRAFT_36156 [Amorphotheca resinae ATCC 22711]PSS12945.1 hypothetical protein M430DRAFT_36156 [Amorphotheca resinae ATCC 22711]
MPPQAPAAQEYARFVLVVILLFFLSSSSDNGPPPGFAGSPRDYAAAKVARQRRNLDVLNTTQWEDFAPRAADEPRFLNLTGFRAEDDLLWDRLGAFRERAALFTDEAGGKWRLDRETQLRAGVLGEVYENVTGIVVGRWVRYTGDLEGGEERHRRYNLSQVTPEVEWSGNEELWDRNITGTEGKLMLRVDERDVEAVDVEGLSLGSGWVREVAATMTIQDESSSGDGWDMRIHGVHWPRQGVMLMTTTSDKFAGLFGLPHLTMDMNHFTSSKMLLNKTLEKTVEKMEKAYWTEVNNPWSSSSDGQGDSALSTPHCEYVVYVQVYPLDLGLALNDDYMDTASIVQQIEQELRFPNGAPTPPAPKMRMSTVIFSPDCGFMLESKGPPAFPSEDGDHLVGRKQEVFLHQVQSWLLVYAAVIFGQVLLLKMQSKEASTPSTVGRISIYTIAMMLMADALLFSSLSLLSATAPNIFPSALLASFAALMSVALGVRFITAVYNVQEPERRERLRVQLAAQAANTPQPSPAPTPSSAPIITAAGADTAPPPGTASAPTAQATANNTPIIIPSDQDIDAEIAEVANAASAVPRPTLPTTNQGATTPTQQVPRASNFGAVYVQFVLALTFILFVSLSALSWPVTFRTFYIHFLSVAYLSFWVPQIRRNIIRNCRKALLWKFIIGQSILRLLPFAYFYLREENVLFSEPDWKAFTALAGWVWIQIWVLAAQEILGPRWGIPKGWTEEGWDYHPILREDNVEAGGLPIGLVRAPGSPTLERVRTGDEGKKSDGPARNIRTVDCAICMQVLEVPVVAAGTDASAAGGVVGMLGRRLYMVTPCRHVFHSACLEGWMRFRLQCPICRENLPPL